MGIRKIVHIDEDRCNGCGDCVPSCAEGAIQIVGGKAKLRADNLCDGLGACLGDCPKDAITIVEREADQFDEEEVQKQMENSTKDNDSKPKVTPLRAQGHEQPHGMGGCPGSRMVQFDDGPGQESGQDADTGNQPSELRQWPVQLHLVSPMAPYFQKADVLLAADCVAFSMGNFHRDFLKGKGLAIACPKLDDGQETYLQKLVSLIDDSQINTLSVMVMEVPCCTGLVHLAKEAVNRASRKVPVKRMVVSLKGEVLDEAWV